MDDNVRLLGYLCVCVRARDIRAILSPSHTL